MHVGAGIGRKSLAIGMETAGSPMAGVAEDAMSLKYLPATAGQWSTVKAAAGIPGTPSFLWRLQEASGNLTDSIGSCTLTLVNTIAGYQQSKAGWSTKGITFADGGTGYFSNTTTPADPATTSSAVLMYMYVTAAPAVNSYAVWDGATTKQIAGVAHAGAFSVRSGATTNNGVSSPFDGSVRPVLLVYNRAAATVKLYTDQEIISTTYAAGSGPGVSIPSLGGTSYPGGMLYAAMFQGAAAEMSDANARSLLKTLNWTIPW